MRDERGFFHVLPGGGQQHGETLEQTVIRECREELGAEIQPLRLCYLREYIGANHDFSPRHRKFHKIEAVFVAELRSELSLDAATETDRRQVGIRWLPLASLREARFLPAALIPAIEAGETTFSNPYLGDLN